MDKVRWEVRAVGGELKKDAQIVSADLIAYDKKVLTVHVDIMPPMNDYIDIIFRLNEYNSITYRYTREEANNILRFVRSKLDAIFNTNANLQTSYGVLNITKVDNVFTINYDEWRIVINK